MAIRQHFRARNSHELDAMWRWIHDAAYSVAEIEWRRQARQVVVPIASPCDDPAFPARKSVGRGVLSESYLEPWFRATLTIRTVRTMNPEPDRLEEPGILEDLDWLPGPRRVCVVSSNDAASFELEVDGFDVALVATDDIDHWRKHTYGRLIEWDAHGESLAEAEDD